MHIITRILEEKEQQKVCECFLLRESANKAAAAATTSAHLAHSQERCFGRRLRRASERAKEIWQELVHWTSSCMRKMVLALLACVFFDDDTQWFFSGGKWPGWRWASLVRWLAGWSAWMSILRSGLCFFCYD
jgi:hypothetical protein